MNQIDRVNKRTSNYSFLRLSRDVLFLWTKSARVWITHSKTLSNRESSCPATANSWLSILKQSLLVLRAADAKGRRRKPWLWTAYGIRWVIHLAGSPKRVKMETFLLTNHLSMNEWKIDPKPNVRVWICLHNQKEIKEVIGKVQLSSQSWEPKNHETQQTWDHSNNNMMSS